MSGRQNELSATPLHRFRAQRAKAAEVEVMACRLRDMAISIAMTSYMANPARKVSNHDIWQRRANLAREAANMLERLKREIDESGGQA